MKHSAQIVTFLTAKTACGAMPLQPAETRPRSSFPESRVTFPRYNYYTDETISMAGTEYFGETAVTGIKTDSHFWIF